MTEIKLKWENTSNGWIIAIPYEINHNFILKYQILANAWKQVEEKILVAWPDYGKGYVLEWKQLDKYIKDCEYFKENLEEIMKKVPLPKWLWEYDDYYIEWFVSSCQNNNYVEFWKKEITKEDILVLLSLLHKKANEAKEKGVAMEFIWD